MSTISGIIPPVAPLMPPAKDPFRYGWREVMVKRADGSVEFDRVPLTLEDLLHPQLGDVMPQSTPHDRDIHYLKDVFQGCVAENPSAVVYHDVIIDWHDPELRHHSPDISVLFGVRDPAAERSSFDVAEEGVRPALLLEVVSPDYRANDVVTKVDQYHRARVPLYIIVDRENIEGPVRLIGYRYHPDDYEELLPDEHGRLWLEPLGVWLGVKDNRVVCYDGETGRELGDYASITRELEEALEREAEAERATVEANLARVRAEQRADEERERADREARARSELQRRADQLQETLNRLLAAATPAPAEGDKQD